MDSSRIAELLRPFLHGAVPCELSLSQFENVSNYLEVLVRWNVRINLTAVREPEEIVQRHFGESLFAARCLFPDGQSAIGHVIDVGSGAGFPGLPIKIWTPGIQLTLIESNQKKATFLREVVRRLKLADVEVFAKRAEDFKDRADVVTLRAVEKFDQAVPLALKFVRPGGRLALLIGEGQVGRAKELASNLEWSDPVAVPLSSNRVLLIAESVEPQDQSQHESA